ncbi:GNAT family N-acetyltransferase [Azospirillum sp. A1-3]|uniref:GNAT family N-acetyltransferase n=1 Tax=Azospirillum sp. A1-3 TaxID=185874 RepID=UPI0020776A17|nr:GNAT family N-acetyltransferase [Azospirillum sp. A1-3]
MEAARVPAGASTGSGLPFETSEAWFSVLASTCLDPGDQPHRLVLPGATLAMRERTSWHGPVALRTLASLTPCYSTRYSTAGVDEDDLAAAARTLRRRQPRVHRLLFEALQDEAEAVRVSSGLRRGGLFVERFQHFGTWYEPVRAGFDAYWSARPGRLRNTVERRERALRRGPGCALRVCAAPEEADAATAAYQAIYQASWKKPEPYPTFIPALIAALLRQRAGLIGLLSIDDQPVAAQIWLVGGGAATLFKLAHDERHKNHSPGSVLTRLMLERILGDPTVREIDFGRGDDPYKRHWVSQRRQSWGVAAYDPATPVGAALAGITLLSRLRSN